MSQIALPLGKEPGRNPVRIVSGAANQPVIDALSAPESWPFCTALLAGPPRSGKSLIARWFTQTGVGGHGGEAIDDADRLDETDLFHRWNRAQERGTPLLLVAGREDWRIALPDLASRLGAALHLVIGEPGDAMVAALIEAHAEQRGLVLGENATTYLAPRTARSFEEIERLVEVIDRLSLERKQPPTLSIWRNALEAVQGGARQGESPPRLL